MPDVLLASMLEVPLRDPSEDGGCTDEMSARAYQIIDVPLVSSSCRGSNVHRNRKAWTAPRGGCQKMLLRKEVIQPHLPVRLPCYDFVPIAGSTLDGSVLAVRPPASGVSNFHDVTGGVYKARERIHRCVLTSGY